MLPLVAVAFGLALVLVCGAYAVARVDAVDGRAALVVAVGLLAVGGVVAATAPVDPATTDTAGDAAAVGERSPATAVATAAEGGDRTPATGTNATGDGTVVGVGTGDRLTYRTPAGSQRTVRLAGVDAPGIDGGDPRRFDGVLTGDRGRTCLADYGRRGLVSLRTDLLDRSVTVDIVDRANGVRTAVVSVDGRSINRQIVERGYARATNDRYADAERAARAAERGLWSCTVVTPERPLRESNESTVRIAAIHPNPPGDDAAALTEEYVVLENAGRVTVDLSNWYLIDGDGHTYFFFDGRELHPGEQLVLHVGEGQSTDGHVYWNAPRPVLDNDHDSIRLVDGDTDRVVKVSY
ncbi:lamin tail domain-containing protein [Haloplanus litoreus]|uniref:Lamin tail domain-containing protein n=1 Tax=Haloplanus litoreus TaxID=767515 RepID=A0ABD5ZWB1_9EURY